MPENPLLPNRKLQALYATMLRAQASASRTFAGLEAVFASIAQQVEPGDALVTTSADSGSTELLRPARRGAVAPAALACPTAPLAFAAGVAAAATMDLEQAGNTRLAVAVLDTARPEAGWAAMLTQAQQDRLPLIIVCPERPARAGAARSGVSSPAALTWAALTPVVRKLRFAVLIVDSADAVAMYRAMQESVLRARHGDGPALLWCLSPPRTRGAHAPAVRLERYMAARKIALPK